MAAVPMAMPSADSAARSLRVRSPTVASPARSAGRSRAGAGADAAVMIAPPLVSVTMRPSSISMRRRIRAATAWSWVITMIVVPGR